MTIYKSTAVNSGIMPDLTMPGVVLVRSAEYTTDDDDIVSGDTIQMIPVPKGARILNVAFYSTPALGGASGCHVGDGSSSARFLDDACMEAAVFDMFGTKGVAAGLGYDYDEGDDTIDLTICSSVTKIPTSTTFRLHVWYKMSGSLDDEDDMT